MTKSQKAKIFSARHAIAVAFVVASSTAAFAVGTDEQRRACTPDVFRLCSSDIPNVERIVACLKRQSANLSPACHSVFQAAGATRSMGAPTPVAADADWCVFSKGDQEPAQRDWLGWCGPGARRE